MLRFKPRFLIFEAVQEPGALGDEVSDVCGVVIRRVERVADVDPRPDVLRPGSRRR